MPSPLVHALLPASCLLVTKRRLPPLSKQAFWRLGAIAVFLANAPDLDLIPGIIHPAYWHIAHRFIGHNLFAGAIWVCLGVWLIRKFVSKDFSPAALWAICILLVASHLVLDASGAVDPILHLRPGVPLFWPLSSERYVLPFVIFNSYHVQSGIHPVLAYYHSQSFWRHVAYCEVFWTVTLFCLWTVIFFGIENLRRLRSSDKSEPESTTPNPQPESSASI